MTKIIPSDNDTTKNRVAKEKTNFQNTLIAFSKPAGAIILIAWLFGYIQYQYLSTLTIVAIVFVLFSLFYYFVIDEGETGSYRDFFSSEADLTSSLMAAVILCTGLFVYDNFSVKYSIWKEERRVAGIMDDFYRMRNYMMRGLPPLQNDAAFRAEMRDKQAHQNYNNHIRNKSTDIYAATGIAAETYKTRTANTYNSLPGKWNRNPFSANYKKFVCKNGNTYTSLNAAALTNCY